MPIIKQNGVVRLVPATTQTIPELEPMIYTVGVDPQGPFLSPMKEKFLVPEDYDFSILGKKIEYLVERAKKETRNVGFLFEGAKGMGKTMAMNVIANALDLPVIIIETNSNNSNDQLFKFIFEFNCDMVIVIDEFEKKLNKVAQEQLLSFFDGVYNSEHKKIFLISANEHNFNDNFNSRLGRIMYRVPFEPIKDAETVKKFLRKWTTGTTEEQIDNLCDMLRRKDCVTVDIIHKVCKDINLMGYDSFVNVGWDMINLNTMKFEEYGPYYYIDKTASTTEAQGRPLSDYVDAMEMGFREQEMFLENLNKRRNDSNDAEAPTAKEEAMEQYINYSHRRTITCDAPACEWKVGDVIGDDYYIVEEIIRKGDSIYFKLMNTESSGDTDSGMFFKTTKSKGFYAFESCRLGAF